MGIRRSTRRGRERFELAPAGTDATADTGRGREHDPDRTRASRRSLPRRVTLPPELRLVLGGRDLDLDLDLDVDRDRDRD